MRTTLDIDEDVLQAAKDLAAGRGTTTGKVISEWGRQALQARVRRRDGELRNGVPVITGPPGSPKITFDDVKRAEEEMDEEDAERYFGDCFVRRGEELKDEPDGASGR